MVSHHLRFRVLLVAVIVLILIVPIPKSFIQEWTVRVVDQNGVPVSGIRIWESWENYTFGLSGWTELYTDRSGKVVFPSQKQFAPLMYWMVKAIGNVLGFGVHAGFGTFGRVWIADQKLRDFPIADPKFMELTAANCSDAHCTESKIESELQLPTR